MLKISRRHRFDYKIARSYLIVEADSFSMVYRSAVTTRAPELREYDVRKSTLSRVYIYARMLGFTERTCVPSNPLALFVRNPSPNAGT